MTEHGVQTVKIMITIADLLNTIIYFHNTANNVWVPYTRVGSIDPTVPALQGRI